MLLPSTVVGTERSKDQHKANEETAEKAETAKGLNIVMVCFFVFICLLAFVFGDEVCTSAFPFFVGVPRFL